MKILFLAYGIAIPFFALAGFLCIQLGQWRTYDFGLFIGMATMLIALEWQIFRQE